MALFDKPLEELRTYTPAREEQADFDAFWADTLATSRSHDLNAQFVPVDSGLRTLEVFDVTYNGYGGQPVKGWLILPSERAQPLPVVVEYIGYGGGRGLGAGLAAVCERRLCPLCHGHARPGQRLEQGRHA